MFRLTITFALLGCAIAGVIEPRSSDNLGGRIVGGEATTIEKFPYQVALLKDDGLFCGGTLISSDIVVTAAHCLQKYAASEIKVRLGSSYYKTGGLLVAVSGFKNHEKYDSTSKINDVALIKLAQKVPFSVLIQPIELAAEVPKSGTPAFITGWGANRFFIGSIQQVLQEAEVDIVSLEDCVSEAYKYKSDAILDTMVCAAVDGGGKDACQGDSGGPLAAEGKLVGVVSWGNMCARKNYPGVYASVPVLRSWIETTSRTF